MFILLRVIFICVPLFCFANTADKKWIVKDLGTIADFDTESILGLNDSGDVLLWCQKFDSGESIYAISSFETGLNILPPKDEKNNIYWSIINSSQAIGVGLRGRSTNIYTFSTEEGLKNYPLIDAINIGNPAQIGIAECHNSNEIVITLNKSIYIFKNQIFTNITKELQNSLKLQGFFADRIEWVASAVNDTGSIIGWFTYYEKHPFKNKYFELGICLFFWDGKTVRYLDKKNTEILSINNNNLVTLSNYEKSYLWDPLNDNLELKHPPCIGNFITVCQEAVPGDNLDYSCGAYISSILDDGTLVWKTLYEQTIVFQKGESILRLSTNENEVNSMGIDQSKYHNLRLFTGNGSLINNNKQVVTTGVFYGESHSFILTPKNK